ncbi:MAG: hypothetical protein JWN21_439 [Sphingomonas bacterium]|uniref:hypothetical protein n=1 Tax=Sphingomonas bacterium TaxID=1895847 RepID=UPI0026285C57|nr:hypothetical protein [Sphingomonas bacterium]MDB5694896.1 hypothetical protein [Sphingomonas bacterium]
MARAVAEELADALDGVVLDNLVKQRDLKETESKLDGHLGETELRLRREIKELELRLTVRLGAMLAASRSLIVAILGGAISLR